MTKEIIAAIGAGRMGRGMAIAFAYAGHLVRLVDVKDRTPDDFHSLNQSVKDEIASTLNMMCSFGMLDSTDLAEVQSRVSCHSLSNAAEALKNVPVVFEGVPETLDAKIPAFGLISDHAEPDAIVASTTSTILSNDLQPHVRNPERFLNAHWLNPAYLVPLVELSPGDKTDPAITSKLKKLLEHIGKVPVVCSASPGYIVPRIQALAMNEAARLVEEGVASAEDVDKATKYGFGFRFAVLGLLEFIDWGGGDILFHASRYMADATGEDRFSAPAIIQENMAESRTGLRDRRGFLDYEGLDVEAYQKERLAAFVAMLNHLGKLPPKG